ncbi:ROK family protein [Dyadobacter sp. CY261]|uniref:ROK family protein n=1 Tax=Dyadobacter sp. CY261 TaxID=2907203 RepID=UPI001F36518B|nr:ROK family protein [Dyadobacter sp. CY261]MCF0069738.1 ROK family protein [Dyadobacter sp. CY261]
MKTAAIGIDIGGTRTKMGLVNLHTGEVLRMLVFDTKKKSASAFETSLHDNINILAGELPAGLQLAGVGIGVSGFVFENGTVDSTYGFLEFMEDYPLAAIIEKKHQIFCRIDNDARLVALGEAVYGIGKDYERVLMLTLGTGVGVGGVVGQALDGRLPFAHMAGHMKVATSDVTCYCGKTGCLEALVSASGITALAARVYDQQNLSESPGDCEQIFNAALAGHKPAVDIINQVTAYLRSGIANYINIYAPDVIILGGGVAKGLKNRLASLHEPGLLGPYKGYHTKIVLSELEEQAGILGAALLFKP